MAVLLWDEPAAPGGDDPAWGAVPEASSQENQRPLGYRTARSMRSQETWRFAHRVCGQLWVVLGGVLLVISLAAAPVTLGWDSEAVSTASLALVGVELAVLVGSIFPVERALKKHFDQFGRRKDGI